MNPYVLGTQKNLSRDGSFEYVKHMLQFMDKKILTFLLPKFFIIKTFENVYGG